MRVNELLSSCVERLSWGKRVKQARLAMVGAALALAHLFISPTLGAQIVSPPSPDSPQAKRCGPKITKNKVLVLDLEQFEEDPEAGARFVERYVTDVEVISERPEVIRTKSRGSAVDRRRAMKRAQKVASQRGCNLVLVMAAWEGEDNAAFAMPLSTGQSIAVGLHYAYARVLVASGTRLPGDKAAQRNE